MKTEQNRGNYLEKSELRFRLALTVLWVSHFLLWTFGDMAALLQQLSEPVESSLLLFVSVPLAMIQVSMIVLSLLGPKKAMARANMILPLAYVVLNVGFLIDAQYGWEYLLGISYITVNVLIIGYARKWLKS